MNTVVLLAYFSRFIQSHEPVFVSRSDQLTFRCRIEACLSRSDLLKFLYSVQDRIILMFFPLFVAFVSLTSLFLSVSHWLSLSLRQQPLYFPCAPVGCQVQVSFSFLSSPLSLPLQVHLAEYWPPDDNKTQQPPRLVKSGQVFYPLFPRFPSCLETLVPAWTHCVFVFVPKSSIPRPLLPDACFFRFKTEVESKRAGDCRDKGEGWVSKMEK